MKASTRYGLQSCFLTIFISAALLSGCAKKAEDVVGPGGGNNGGGNGGSPSDSARNVIIDSAVAFINRLPHITPDADNQAVLQYFQSHSEFEASGISPLSSVWARFTDGRLFIFANDIAISPGLSSSVPGGSTKHRSLPRPTEIHNLPSNTRIRLLNAMGPLFNDLGAEATNTDVRSWSNSIGYTDPLGQPDATVDGLKQVQGDGVFYMTTHGGAGETRSNESIYCLMTSEEVSPAGDMRHKLELDSGYVVVVTGSYAKDSDGNIIYRDNYAITPRFVQRYMSFGATSLVFFNACGSDDATMKAACMAKNASVYFGWSKPATAPAIYHTARYLFDRLLGTNQFEPEDPHQRPFNYSLVLEDMHHRGYDTTRSNTPGPSVLTATPPFGQTGTELKLAPSIMQVTPIASPGTTMDIDGLFGSEQGTVVLGSTNLGIINWAPTKIRCTAPENGGNLTVKVRGIKSNTTQLTQWHGQFDYTLSSRGSLQHHVLFDLTFWADVHMWRLLPHHQPFYFDPRLAHLSTSSTCTFESSGEYRDQNGNLVETWSGNGFAPVLQTGNEPAYYVFVGIVDSSGANSTIVLSFRGTYTNNGTQSSFSIQGNLGTLAPRMNSSFVLPGNTLQWSSGTDHATMTWGDLQPTFPPDPNGPR